MLQVQGYLQNSLQRFKLLFPKGEATFLKPPIFFFLVLISFLFFPCILVFSVCILNERAKFHVKKDTFCHNYKQRVYIGFLFIDCH